MRPSRLLQQNVRPQRVEEDVDYLSDDAEELSAGDRSAISDQSSESDGAHGAESEDESDVEEQDALEENAGGDVKNQISNISFGALKQAQDAISRKRKRDSNSTPDQEQKLEALRERLQQIKAAKGVTAGEDRTKRESSAKSRRLSEKSQVAAQDTGDDDDDDESSDSDSAPSEEGAHDRSRTSKHAPAAQSSKYQVSRKRIVIDVPKRNFRDPRFDALQQRSGHPGDSDKAYGFLREYQQAEIAELKAAMKRTKNEEDKEILKRKAGSMENRLKAKAAKERTQEVIRKHRREEREKVEQGKTPYYLKKKDIKERALVEKFKGMKSKEREKLIEKRQRKESQKEKKRMPNARRMAG